MSALPRKWKKLIIGALAVVACVVWFLLPTDKKDSSNPFGEADAERIGREYGAKRPDWQEIKVDVSGVRGGRWYVTVSRIPPQPGGHFSLELDENGKVTNIYGGK